MKDLFKKVTALMLSCTFMITMAACDNKNKNTEETNTAKGRYIEEDYSLPAGLGDGDDIYSLEKLEDNTLQLAAGSSKTVKVYTSKDGGKTWKTAEQYSSIIPKGTRIGAAAIDRKGNMIISYGVPVKVNGVEKPYFEGELSYIKVSNDGKSTALNIKLPVPDKKPSNAEVPSSGITSEKGNDGRNSLQSFKIAANGDILGMDDYNNILQIDSANLKIKNTYTYNGRIDQYGVVGTTLIIAGDESVEQYDITSYKQLKESEVLKSYLSSGDKNRVVRSLLSAGSGDNELYFCNDNGLYRYTLGGTIVEQLVDGSLTSLGSMNMDYINMTENTNDDFLVIYESNDSTLSMMNYAYSKETPAAPEKEITVYSLKDNKTIRQAISLFQKANPDIHVIFEVGVSGKDAVSVSDALKQLNTEIMAGKGPDVLLLDQMPVESYIEKGILKDMSGIMNDYIKNGSLFEKIAGAYKEKDKIYAAPIRFEIPVINAENDVLSRITDIKTLADYSAEYREKNPKSGNILGIYNSEGLVRKLYPANAGDWIKKDGTVDRNKLTGFFTQVKRIYEASMKNKKPEDIEAMNGKAKANIEKGGMSAEDFYRTYDEAAAWAFDVANGGLKVNIGTIGSFLDVARLTSSSRKNSDVSYKPLNEGKGYFIPSGIIGINEKTQDIENAGKFVSYLFSDEGQDVNVDLTGGFPVNRAAFNAGKSASKQDEALMGSELGSKEDEVVWPGEKQLDDFSQIVENLDTPTFDNTIILDAVLQVSDKCVKGEISVDSAVKSVMDKVNLYLSEQR